MDKHKLAGNLPESTKEPPKPRRLKPPDRLGDPSSHARIDHLVKKMLCSNSVAAAQALCETVKDPTVSAGVRCRVAGMILDRVYGKAAQPIDASFGAAGNLVVVQFKGPYPLEG